MAVLVQIGLATGRRSKSETMRTGAATVKIERYRGGYAFTIARHEQAVGIATYDEGDHAGDANGN